MISQEIMEDFDEDKYIKSYCKSKKCNMCNGSNFNGESNGYGCEGLEKRINNMYNSILNRRKKKLGIV